MGLDSVIAKIKKDAEDEISKIELETNVKSDEIVQGSEKRGNESYLKKMEDAQKRMNTLTAQEMSGAELEAKKIQLVARKETLDKTFQECLAVLSSLDHKTVIAMLMTKVKRELPEAKFIYSNKRDEHLVRSFSGLAYGGNIECIGGIVAENSDKTLTLDLKYETIAMTVWDSNLKGIANRLFG